MPTCIFTCILACIWTRIIPHILTCIVACIYTCIIPAPPLEQGTGDRRGTPPVSASYRKSSLLARVPFMVIFLAVCGVLDSIEKVPCWQCTQGTLWDPFLDKNQLFSQRFISICTIFGGLQEFLVHTGIGCEQGTPSHELYEKFLVDKSSLFGHFPGIL